ncbi:MAG: signal peptidase I [Candidatus Symbiobacter sp.]|nr:signal peptidase I [Candidatus Symbiobacter sp.]
MFNRLKIETSPQKAPPPRAPGPMRDFIDMVKTVFYALIIVFFVRGFGFEAFNIPSGSMIPSLLIGDFLFVSKYSYGYSRYSVPMLNLILPHEGRQATGNEIAANDPAAAAAAKNGDGRWLSALPARGDIIVFKWPGDNDTDYIKRVIALPGDKIEVRDGSVWLNGKALPRQPVPGLDGRLIDPTSGRFAERFIETLPSGRQFVIQKFGGNQANDNFPEQCPDQAQHCPVTVPPHHLFVMGDNRDNSADSRVPAALGGAGFVPVENIVGKAQILFFSLDEKSSWWEIWKWPFAVRWSRLMNWIR